MSKNIDRGIDYFSSARTGDMHMVKHLLHAYPGGYWIIKNKEGISPMQLAATYGQTEVLKAFVDHGGGMDLNLPTDNSYLETPLNLAQVNHHDETYFYIREQPENCFIDKTDNFLLRGSPGYWKRTNEEELSPIH